MKQDKILTIVLDGTEPRIVELENSCEAFCDTIGNGCTMIDVVEIDVNGVTFDAIIDDEGLYNSPEKVTAIWGDADATTTYQTLHGTVILCHCDEEGNQESINLIPDLTAVYSNLIRITNQLTGEKNYGVAYNVGQVPPTREELLEQYREIFGKDFQIIGA